MDPKLENTPGAPNQQPLPGGSPQKPLSDDAAQQSLANNPAQQPLATADNNTSANQARLNPVADETQPSQPIQPSQLSQLSQSDPSPQPAQPEPSPQLGQQQPASKPKSKFLSNLQLKNLLTQWYFWAMIGAGIFGIIGIVLGVYGMVEKSVAEQKVARLQTELDAANELVVKYGTQLGEKVNELGKPGNAGGNGENADEVLDSLASATKNYIYVGEWGIKIKIPKGLKNASYTFQSSLAESNETTADGKAKVVTTETLCISALLDEMRYTPENFALATNPEGLGCLSRSTDKNTESYLNYVGKVGDYYYRYDRSQGVDSYNEQETQWFEQASELVNEALASEKELTSFKNN